MRITAIAALLTVIGVASASGQTAATPYAYGLDPYNPQDAEILRNYGSVLVAQTPLSELRKLDPYNPTHAALLRSLGGGIPLWAPWYLPAPLPASPLFPAAAGPAPPHVVVLVVDQRTATTEPAGAASPSTAATPGSLPEGIATVRRPESNDGVWIRFAGQTWISAGPAVPFDEASFVRVGEYGDFPVLRVRNGSEDVIYVPTRQDLVAPYRLKR